MSGLSTIERAIELAKTGRFRTISGLKDALRAERSDGIDAHLAGAAIKKQLIALMESAAARNSD